MRASCLPLLRIIIFCFLLQLYIGDFHLTNLLENYLRHSPGSLHCKSCKLLFLVMFNDYWISFYDASYFHIVSQCSRIEDNQFSGKIPDFIQNWTSINKLYDFFLILVLFLKFNCFCIALIFKWIINGYFSFDRMIQGSGLSGPIPSGISQLTNLTDLYVWYYIILIKQGLKFNFHLIRFTYLWFQFDISGELVIWMDLNIHLCRNLIIWNC